MSKPRTLRIAKNNSTLLTDFTPYLLYRKSGGTPCKLLKAVLYVGIIS